MIFLRSKQCDVRWAFKSKSVVKWLRVLFVYGRCRRRRSLVLFCFAVHFVILLVECRFCISISFNSTRCSARFYDEYSHFFSFFHPFTCSVLSTCVLLLFCSMHFHILHALYVYPICWVCDAHWCWIQFSISNPLFVCSVELVSAFAKREI